MCYYRNGQPLFFTGRGGGAVGVLGIKSPPCRFYLFFTTPICIEWAPSGVLVVWGEDGWGGGEEAPCETTGLRAEPSLSQKGNPCTAGPVD